jgi:regulator of cell morphogenesis and NO signaling
MKEEEILFPHIKYLVKSKANGTKIESPYFGTVQNPIRLMESEHQNAGDELFEIRRLSNSYKVPEDACNTFSVTFQELKEFEEDLHKHVHLENSILFPKSIQLEAELSS